MDTFKTPEIPDWVREINHACYKNIFSYDLGNSNLWGTETLLGDWDGEYLLIAKDFYPARYIDDAVAAGVKSPYRHGDDKHSTNEDLASFWGYRTCVRAQHVQFPLRIRVFSSPQ
jgi:hypothetical protein